MKTSIKVFVEAEIEVTKENEKTEVWMWLISDEIKRCARVFCPSEFKGRTKDKLIELAEEAFEITTKN